MTQGRGGAHLRGAGERGLPAQWHGPVTGGEYPSELPSTGAEDYSPPRPLSLTECSCQLQGPRGCAPRPGGLPAATVGRWVGRVGMQPEAAAAWRSCPPGARGVWDGRKTTQGAAGSAAGRHAVITQLLLGGPWTVIRMSPFVL